MKKSIFIILLLVLFGCSGHPTISPQPLKFGETYQAITISYESILPTYVFRVGVSDKTNIGLRIGLPIHGSGMDISKVLRVRKNKTEMINFAYTFSSNPSYDATYYKITQKNHKGIYTYWGLRGSYIPFGISGNESKRVGLVLGYHQQGKWGYEIGYLHDVTTITFDDEIIEDNLYGIPNENSWQTGLSIRINFSINN